MLTSYILPLFVTKHSITLQMLLDVVASLEVKLVFVSYSTTQRWQKHFPSGELSNTTERRPCTLFSVLNVISCSMSSLDFNKAATERHIVDSIAVSVFVVILVAIEKY